MLAEVRRVVPSTISLRLVLVGDGPQRKAVERQVRRDAMGSWVGLTGRLGRAQVREVLAGADIYVAPARLESFGIAALEARSVGLPIVAKRSGGVSSFVRSGEEGLLTGRDRDMTRCIAELVASPQLRAAMTAHNRSHPPELGWSATMITTGALYSRAVLLAGGARVAVEPSTQTDPRPAVAQ
jgi:glycosyltransferase involved in cell wall biosynthesis